MQKAVVAGLSAVGVIVAAFVLAPTAWTQARPAPEPRPEVRRMWLDGRGSSIGVRVRDLDTEDLAKAKLQQAGGVLIDDVDADSPAEKAGVRRGDVVVEFDGERVRSARHFARLVQETPDGRTVKATIVREGARQTVDVTPSSESRFGMGDDVMIHMPNIEREIERGLRALPRNFSFDFDWDDSVGALPGGRGRLGARLQTLTPQLAEYFGAKDGVLVASVEPDSAAAKAGLRAGDVITSVNGRPASDPRDVTRDIREADEGKEVEIAVMRERKPLTLKVQLPDRQRPAARRYTRPA